MLAQCVKCFLLCFCEARVHKVKQDTPLILPQDKVKKTLYMCQSGYIELTPIMKREQWR
jgi:hypothetical protein